LVIILDRYVQFSLDSGTAKVTIMGLTVARVVMVIAAAFVVVFSILSAVFAYRSEIRHRVLWAFLCLLGSPVTTMNWSTGAVGTRLLRVQVLGVGAVKPRPDAPWFLSVAFPVGAVLFRARRKKLIAAHRPLRAEDQIQ
jgi:hypothetical protein